MVEFAIYRGNAGVWMIYDYDGPAHLISLHSTSVKAIEALAELGAGKVGFYPINKDFHDAVADWERMDRG